MKPCQVVSEPMDRKGAASIGIAVAAIITFISGAIGIGIFASDIMQTFSAAAGAQETSAKVSQIQQTIDQKCDIHAGSSENPQNPNTRVLQLSRIKSISTSEISKTQANSQITYRKISGTQKENSYCEVQLQNGETKQLNEEQKNSYTVSVSCKSCDKNVPELLLSIEESS